MAISEQDNSYDVQDNVQMELDDLYKKHTQELGRAIFMGLLTIVLPAVDLTLVEQISPVDSLFFVLAAVAFIDCVRSGIQATRTAFTIQKDESTRRDLSQR